MPHTLRSFLVCRNRTTSIARVARRVSKSLLLLLSLGATNLTAAQALEQWAPPEPRVPSSKIVLPEAEMTLANAQAAEAEFNAPIRDELGRVRYIIDLRDSATDGFSRTSPPKDGFPEYLKTETRHLAASMAAEYGFKPLSLTSWIGNTITAYLSEDQVAQIRKDSKVMAVLPDQRVRFSAALWQNSGRYSWGTYALGSVAALPNATPVYVVDTGVGYHYDLPYVTRYGATQTTNPIGCYAHSTHISGIIGGVGATPAGNVGSKGVIPGIPLISVGVGRPNSMSDPCNQGADENAVVSAIMDGLEFTRSHIAASGKVGVINLSLNRAEFKAAQLIGTKITLLKTPAAGYAGAFVVQSAGNGTIPLAGYPFGVTQDACNVSYDAKISSDGVMVVGALDANGQQVVPLAGVPGFVQQAGSNYGTCVDVWAPGKNIASTWKVQSAQTTPALSTDGHMVLSGTSMAAPHVSAIAAHLARSNLATSPSQVEAMVRYYMFDLGSKAQDGAAVYTLNLNGQRPIAIPTAVFAIGGSESNRTGASSLGYLEAFNLRYASIGAVSCTLTGFLNGSVWYQNVNFLPAYDWGTVSLTTGQYQWTVDCVSAAGTHNTATISATVNPPAPPTANFYIDQVPQVNGATYNYIYNPSNPVSKYFSYGSSGEANCDLTVHKGPIGGTLSPWYSVAGLGTSYVWGYTTWAPYAYRYRIDCYGGPAGPISTTLNILSN